MSTSAVWAGSPGGSVSHMDALAEHFRVIAPDMRGHGMTVNPGGGPMSFAQLADDLLGLIDALHLDGPMLCGFSMGATVATIAAIRNPGAVRALVNDAGYDPFNPKAPSFTMLRQMLGGGPDATKADAPALERFFAAQKMGDFFNRMKADHDGARGPGSWQSLITGIFDGATSSPGYTFEDLRKITAPTLILTGDRDICCSVEEAVTSYRMLSKGELAILPGHGHYIPTSAVQASVEFLKKY